MLFFSESGCKDRNFQALLPNVFGSFFIFLFFRSLLKRKEKEKTGSFHTANHPHHVNHSALLLLQSGCKSRAFYNTNKIYDTFFFKKNETFFITG